MRVGVTGASGLIGHSLVRALEERGDKVSTFVRPTTGANAVLPSSNTVRWDPEHGNVDESDWQRAGGFDAIVNLAGAGIGDERWSVPRQDVILTSRTSATRLMVRALRDLSDGATFLASGSAIGWYGSRGDELLDETSDGGAGFLADVCAQWEGAATTWRESGAGVALLRTGIVLGARSASLRRQLPLFRLGLGGRLGSGQQWLSPVSLLDEVRAILWVIDHRLNGPVNLVCPHPTTNQEFTRTFAQQLHRPAFFAVPRPALGLAIGSKMANELVLASQRVAPGALSEAGFQFEHSNISEALRWALRPFTP